MEIAACWILGTLIAAFLIYPFIKGNSDDNNRVSEPESSISVDTSFPSSEEAFSYDSSFDEEPDSLTESYYEEDEEESEVVDSVEFEVVDLVGMNFTEIQALLPTVLTGEITFDRSIVEATEFAPEAINLWCYVDGMPLLLTGSYNLEGSDEERYANTIVVVNTQQVGLPLNHEINSNIKLYEIEMLSTPHNIEGPGDDQMTYAHIFYDDYTLFFTYNYNEFPMQIEFLPPASS